MRENAIKQDFRVLNAAFRVSSCATPPLVTSMTSKMCWPMKLAAPIQDTQAADEVRVLREFFRVLNDDPDRAFYEFKQGRLPTRLKQSTASLSQTRCSVKSDIRPEKGVSSTLWNLCRTTEEKSTFFSSSRSGEQLALVSGVAAILRFPMPGHRAAQRGRLPRFFVEQQQQQQQQQEEEDEISGGTAAGATGAGASAASTAAGAAAAGADAAAQQASQQQAQQAPQQQQQEAPEQQQEQQAPQQQQAPPHTSTKTPPPAATAGTSTRNELMPVVLLFHHVKIPFQECSTRKRCAGRR